MGCLDEALIFFSHLSPCSTTRMEAERLRTASVSRSRPPPLKRLLSVEEQDKLKNWEALKRRESEDEERALRRLEAEVHQQRQVALEAERAKLAESVEKERAETEARCKNATFPCESLCS